MISPNNHFHILIPLYHLARHREHISEECIHKISIYSA